MLAYFKKRVSKNILTTVIVCAIIIVIAMCVSKFNFIKYITGPSKADMLTPMSELEGKYVSFDHYFGIVGPEKNHTVLDNLVDKFWDGAETIDKYHFTGSVRKINTDAKSGKSEKYYWDDTIKAIRDTGYDQYFDMSFVEAYTVDYDKIGTSSKFLVIVCFWGMLVVALYAIFHVVMSMISYDAPIKKFIASTPGQSMEKLEASFARAEKISPDVFVSADYIYYRKYIPTRERIISACMV